jgi:hypothetical protein
METNADFDVLMSLTMDCCASYLDGKGGGEIERLTGR